VAVLVAAIKLPQVIFQVVLAEAEALELVITFRRIVYLVRYK
jgi:hypothetical protein